MQALEKWIFFAAKVWEKRVPPPGDTRHDEH